MIDVTIITCLNKMIADSGIKQNHIAKKTGIHPVMLSKTLANDPKYANEERINKIMDYLKTVKT